MSQKQGFFAGGVGRATELLALKNMREFSRESSAGWKEREKRGKERGNEALEATAFS